MYDDPAHPTRARSGVLEIKDAPVSMSWDFSTTLFDDSAPEGYRGTVFLPGKGIYYEARIACADLAHISKNGWAGFWSGTMPIASRPRNMNPPPWSLSVENMPMPGWPGKWETIENDIMEYNPSWGHPQQFDSTIHDWSSGAESGNIGNFNAVVYTPAGTDYTQWHTYGQLWIPATAAERLARLPAGLLRRRSAAGYLLDRQPDIRNQPAVRQLSF